MKPRRRGPALVLLLGLLALPMAGPSYADAGRPTVALSQAEAAKGADIAVTGQGWRPDALLMMLVCGQSTRTSGVIGGTNSCANADGQAVTTDAKGSFSKELPVAEPPKPCPCVVHMATVKGEQAAADTVFKVAGHPVAPLPTQTGDAARRYCPTPVSKGERPPHLVRRAAEPDHRLHRRQPRARPPSRTPSSSSAPRTACSRRSGRTGQWQRHRRTRQEGARSSSTSNCRRAPTATTRSR